MRKNKINCPIIAEAIRITGSQENLARACNVSQAAVWKWLHKLTNPKYDNIKKIVSATKGKITTDHF